MVSHHFKVTEQNNMSKLAEGGQLLFSAIIIISNLLQCPTGITTWVGKLNKLCLIPEDLVEGFLCRHKVPVEHQGETAVIWMEQLMATQVTLKVEDFFSSSFRYRYLLDKDKLWQKLLLTVPVCTVLPILIWTINIYVKFTCSNYSV